jgi:hypothetical protein
VIEEEGLQLHFEMLVLGCFYCLGFGLFADRRKKGVGKGKSSSSIT